MKKSLLALTAMILLLAPYLVCLSAWAVDPVVADPPTAAPDAGAVAPAATGLNNTDNTVYNPPSTNTVTESAEQDTSSVITNTTNTLMQAIATRESGRNTDVYNGMAAWVGDDIFSNLFSNIGQVIGRWLSEFIDGWISSTVQFLSSFLRTFVLNPNIAVSGVQNTPGQATAGADDISPYVREAAGTMYGIAIDLLLLLFILCIWKFWAEAAWRGGGHILGAVGRLIFTAGLMLAWPTIYAFEIQITNEMIQAIYFTGGDQITQLDVALTAAVKAGLVATTGLLANAFAPVIGGAVGGAVGGTVGGIVAFAGLIIYLVLGVVLITQIVYILVLKAIQTGLLTAQYMFAPIFLVFFATPDTENITAGFVRSFCEVSLWTFVWVGLLKIMVIILYSQFNPWGKITMAVGILQIMIQVPTFLARAQISPMSDFISAGLVTGGLMKGASALANKAAGAMTQFSRYVTSDMYGARGMPTSKKTGMENTPTGAANAELMESLRGAGKGVTPGGVPGKSSGAANALGKDLENPLNKTPAKDGDELKNKLATNGLGTPDGKHVSPIGATPDSQSAAALRNMSPAEQAKKALLATAGGAALGAVAATAEARSTMAGGEAGKSGEASKGLQSDEAKMRAAADKFSAGLPVQPPLNKGQTKPQTEAEKAAAAKAAADPANANKEVQALGGAEATNATKEADLATRLQALASAPPKVKTETKADGTKTDPKAGETPAAALNALPIAAAATGLTANRRSNLLNGPGGDKGRTVTTAASADGTSKDGNKVEQTMTTRVPVSANAEDAQASVNNVVSAEGGAKPPQGQVKQGAGNTTTLGTAGAPLNPDGSLNLAALANLPPGLKQPGDTATKGGRRVGADGSRAVETANSRPSVNNGMNTDPTTVRQAVSVPAGSVEDGGRQSVNVEQEAQGRHGRGAVGTPVIRQTGSAAGNDFNPAATALEGLTGAAIGAAAVRSAGGGGNGGGPRNLSLPGSSGGAGGGGGAGGNGGNDSAYVSFPASPAPGQTRAGQPIAATGMQMFDQANYRWVPGRSLLTDIRTAAGPQQGDAADGQSAITMGQRGVASVRYGQGATSEQKALMLMTAGYAGVFSQDPAAFDAARQSAIDAGGDKPRGMAQQIASNWLQYSGGSFKSTAIAKNQFQQTLMEQATLGAESYVNGSSGNAYTGYLRGRYGAMTADQQAWGMHITSDPSSPESGWSTTVGPATDTLVKAGMPITAENRAAASNQAVMRQPQWARGQAVRGVAAYLGAMADESLGPNAHPLERDAFVGRLAPQLSSETVEACRAIVAEAPNGQGATLCARPDYVNSVASLMASPDAPRKLDASTAFRNMSGVLRGGNGTSAGMQTIDILSSNGGGGGGYSGGTMGGAMAAPPPGMGGFNNAVIDTQYRDMSGGGQGGGFTVPGAAVYASNNASLGNTIVRGANGGLSFANQTVHTTLDVLPGQSNGNLNVPTNLGSQVAGVSQTDVSVTANILGGNNNTSLPPSLGTQIGPNVNQRTDVKLSGIGGANAVSHTEMHVQADIIPSNGPVDLPQVGQLASTQNVQSQTTANVSMGSMAVAVVVAPMFSKDWHRSS